MDNWKEKYEELIKYLQENLSDEVKKEVFFEIIFMTYSYVHNAINQEAFPDAINLYDKDLMMVRGRGKYMYKKEIREDGSKFFKEIMRRYFPDNKIKYIV